jgi:hypothetical protein
MPEADCRRPLKALRRSVVPHPEALLPYKAHAIELVWCSRAGFFSRPAEQQKGMSMNSGSNKAARAKRRDPS